MLYEVITEVSGLKFFDSLYFSGITFLTIGYGEITPVGIVRILAIFEGVIGILGLSSFLVARITSYNVCYTKLLRWEMAFIAIL